MSDASEQDEQHSAAGGATADPPSDLAGRLLDAQVAWVLRELDPDGLAATLAMDVRAVASGLEGVTLHEITDPAAVRALVRAVLLLGPRTPLFAAGMPRGLRTGHDSVGRSPDRLSDVASREDVASLADALLALRGDGRLLTRRLLTSPTATTVGVRVVGRIVADVLAQNRSVAEKLPGVGGLISLGSGAINRAGRLGKAVADTSGLDKVLGDALGAGAAVTIKRTSAIVHETITDDVVRAIVLELYDAHADTPVAQLRVEASDEQIDEIAASAHRLVVGATQAPGAAAVIDDQVDAVLEAYADTEVLSLLADLGLTGDASLPRVSAVLAPALTRLHADGTLERLVRAHLAPFWASAEVAALLDAGRDAPA